MPTIKLVFILILSLINSNLFGGPPQSFGGSSGGGSSSNNSNGGTFKEQNYSGQFMTCEKILKKPFRNFHHSQNQGGFLSALKSSDIYSDKNNEMMKDILKSVGDDTTADTSSNEESKLHSDQEKEIAEWLDYLMLCQATSYSFNYDNYISDQFEYDGGMFGESKAAFSGGALECLNSNTSVEKQRMCQMQQQATAGDDIKCVHFGPETHDYIACKRIIGFLDGFVIGKQAMGMQQSFRVGSSALDAQSKLAQKAREGGIGIEDSLGVQKDSLKQQGNMAYEMAAYDGAKAGTLMSMIGNFPRPSGMINTCESQLGDIEDNLNEIYEGPDSILEKVTDQIIAKMREEGIIAEENPNGSNEQIANVNGEGGASGQSEGGASGQSEGLSEAEKVKRAQIKNIKEKSDLFQKGASARFICDKTISTRHGGNKLFVNQKMIEKIRGIAAQSGLEALANGLKGKLLFDQADKVDDVIDDIEEYEPPEFPIAEIPPAEDEQLVSECLVNPEAKGCPKPELNKPYEGFGDGGFSANIGGSANLGSNTQGAGLDEDENTGSGAGTGRDLIPNSIGSIDGNPGSNTDFETPGTVASMKPGSGGFPPGGGGGPAGGGAGAGGGGGGNGGSGGGKGSGKRDINFKGKGDGLAAIGGRGRIGGRKSKKAANPFSKLLKGKKGNNSMKFRGPASLPKKGSLFEMISKRYSAVQSKDRLLKYKIKK